jgi:linearmycin/streptolysin S transport system ATP-binding protein
MNPACSPAPQPVGLGPRKSTIDIERVSKVFRNGLRPALDDVTLSVPTGVIFGMLGPNGAGKTTLLSIVCGLLKPSAGRVRVDGRDVSAQASTIKRVLGVVPQEPAIYPTMTARENLEYFGRMQGLHGRRLSERVRACLSLAGLEEVAEQRVGQFSGGFKRRLNLVIGLIHEPRILILDEPTVAIDPHSRAFIHQRMRELHAAGVSIVISTHYMDEAESLCHDIAIINQGRIVAHGAVDELLKSQRSQNIQLQLEREAPPALEAALRRIPGVHEASVNGRCILLRVEAPAENVLPVLETVKATGIAVTSLSFGTSSLEQVFLALTGAPSER